MTCLHSVNTWALDSSQIVTFRKKYLFYLGTTDVGDNSARLIHVVGEHAPADVAGTCFFFFFFYLWNHIEVTESATPVYHGKPDEFCFFRLKMCSGVPVNGFIGCRFGRLFSSDQPSHNPA